MYIMNISAQIIGIIGMLFAFISFQFKDTKRFCIMQSFSALSFFTSFIMLGAYTGAVLNLINIPRGIIMAIDKRYRKGYMLYVILAAFTVFTVITYNGVLSVMLLIASVVSTLFMWSGNGKLIRIGQVVCVSPIWLVHNIITASVGGILCETFNIISVIIYGIRCLASSRNTEKI